MEISSTALALIGLVLAAWTVGAAAMMVRAASRERQFEGLRKSARRLNRLLDEAPAIPMLVRTDGRIEAPDRLAGWLGLDQIPQFLSELSAGAGQGLSDDQLAELAEAVKRTQKTAMPFQMAVTPPGSQRSLALRGCLADQQVAPGGAALIWFFDFSESENELAQLRETAARAKGDFAALVGLIEAAPMPMWFRGTDMRIKLVNRAYVEAVGGESAQDVVDNQLELLEASDGMEPGQIARQAAKQGLAMERIAATTIRGERRSLKVSDLPLGKEGVAGYAIDIEEQEQQARAFRAFRRAQRAMLDQLSVGVAQFDERERLVFANQPFHRLFDLPTVAVTEALPFERFLSEAREKGRTPEVRDFPEWRREHSAWFGAQEALEEAWPLSGGTHLRVVAQPMPDGGLVLIAEDRTEQLAISATRDTLLRTRTAMLDSLFEAIAVFAPDGSLQIWNRSFAGTWGLDPQLLDSHPSADKLLEAIGPNLQAPKMAKAIGDIIRAATLDRKERGGRINLADGRTLEFAGVPLPDGNGLLTVIDITDSQKAELALRERNKALVEADRVKTNFLSNMSYEFRTPLTSIGGFAELIKSGAAGEISPQIDEYVSAILQAVEKLREQVENVLDLSQSEAGLLPIVKEKVEILPLVRQLLVDRENAIAAAGITVDLQGDKAQLADCDPRQLSRALGHLIDNAIVATDGGGRILIEIALIKGATRIVISDNGRGMGRRELARLNGDIKEPNDGLPERKQGLGIPLARQLIEAHGGALKIQSHKGSGTTAYVALP